MMITLVAAGLAAACVLVILRPFVNTRHAALDLTDDDPETDRGGELIRQLRDLDEDLATGKLDEHDHRRLRGPVERQAAEALRRVENEQTENKRIASQRASNHRAAKKVTANKVAEAFPAVHAARGRRQRTLCVALPAGAVAGRHRGPAFRVAQRAHSRARPSLAPRRVSAPQRPDPTPAPNAAAQPPRAAQIAAVDAAVAKVTRSPKDVEAHLDLAQAYADAGTPQLSAIEYLAVTQLEPGNASANTQLATIAFAAGQTAQAKKLVDTALSAHPGYPEALYVRGLIALMGLRDPAAAEARPQGLPRRRAERITPLLGRDSPGHHERALEMTGLGYISVSGCHASLSLLESLTYRRDELRRRLPVLRSLSGASALVVLSTCQRVELYATWNGTADPGALLRSLSANRGVPLDALASAATSGQRRGCGPAPAASGHRAGVLRARRARDRRAGPGSSRGQPLGQRRRARARPAHRGSDQHLEASSPSYSPGSNHPLRGRRRGRCGGQAQRRHPCRSTRPGRRCR